MVISFEAVLFLSAILGAQQACPFVSFSESLLSYFQMEEVSLLVDTLKQLDELFLSVVVVSGTTSRLMLIGLLFFFAGHFVDGVVFIFSILIETCSEFEAH